MEIEILYSDKDIAVCIKPVGKDSEKDMAAILGEQLGASEVYCVHRLDMAVGGAMVYALNKKSAAALSTQIAAQQMKKEYLAIVRGKPEEESGLLRDLLYRDKAKNKSYVVKRKRAGVKEAELEYRCIARNAAMSLVHITLHTGRSHQIRVQFSSRKHPLLGDGKYGAHDRCPIALVSHKLTLPHPINGNIMSFTHRPSGMPWELFNNI